MDWFERLTGFRETNGDDVRAKLEIDGPVMRSSVNGWEGRTGTLTTPTLAELRTTGSRHLHNGSVERGPTTVREVVADVTALHLDPANAGSVIQAASQFNLLEMVSPDVTPEAGVGIYDKDPTQGPACARACGAGTVYRNWFVPVAGQVGQTRFFQIDCLATMGAYLGNNDRSLWIMRNGYALATRAGLATIADIITDPERRGGAIERLRIGVQAGTEVTAAATGRPGTSEHRPGHTVTQIYGSALPVAYSGFGPEPWEPFARLILEASYEATLWAAVINKAQGSGGGRHAGSATVYLTLLGGGVFGNEMSWIVDAIAQAVERHADHGLDIAIVSYRQSNPALAQLLSSR